MEGTEHKNFFRTRKVLALLPLAALTGVVFWHVSTNRAGTGTASSGGDPAAAAQPFAQPARPAVREEAAKTTAALDIQGSPEFKGQVTGALKLIWLADRETLLFIKKNIYIIRNEDKTGFYLDGGQPVAAVSNAHAFRSMPWCAGIIAHQAFHASAYFSSKKKQKFFPPPPGTAKDLPVAANPMLVAVTSLGSVLDIEKEASEFQAKIMAEAGASRAELRSVKNRAPRSFSTGHDGNYSLTP